MSDATGSSPSPVLTGGLDGFPGLGWAYRFSKTGAARLVQGQELREALEKQEAWLWLNFDLTNGGANAAIATLPHLSPAALAMLRSNDERQQIDGFGPAIGGIAADYESRDPLAEKIVVRWNFVMTSSAFFSAQRRPSHALEQLRIDLESGRRLPDVLALFHALVHELASAISLIMNELGAKLNELEEQLLDQKEVGLDILGQLRRRLVRVRRHAVPFRGMLTHIVSERPFWFDSDALAECQRVAGRMDSLVDDLDTLQERGHTLQDELRAREAEKTTKRLTVLAVVSALLLPPSFISGVFGMNVSGLPFQENGDGFWVTCGLMATSVVGMLVVLRRIRLI